MKNCEAACDPSFFRGMLSAFILGMGRGMQASSLATLKTSNLDWGTLSLERLIAHDIPRHLKSDDLADIGLSEAVPSIPKATMDFFSKRLKGTLLMRGQLVDPDPKLQSKPLADAANSWFASRRSNLVAFSQVAARHLYAVQNGATSHGLLAVAEAKFLGGDAIVIMKLPHEQGIRVRQVKIGGRPTLKVEVLGDLTLTENTRVFKAGVFWSTEGAGILGVVSDDQQGDPSEIAGFFLTDFLGCRLVQKPHVLTRNFKRAVEDFISKDVEDNDQKLVYFQSLSVELRSNTNKIDALEFVQKHFAREHKAPLSKRLAEYGVPESAFVKDISRLARKGRSARMRTKGGLTIFGDAAAVERITTRELDGEQVIIIHDSLSSVG